MSFGTTVCFANKYFPDVVNASNAYKVTNWLFGCHPYHNYSFVATVGATRPKAVFYGNNRADFSFIPGNVAPGQTVDVSVTLTAPVSAGYHISYWMLRNDSGALFGDVVIYA